MKLSLALGISFLLGVRLGAYLFRHEEEEDERFPYGTGYF